MSIMPFAKLVPSDIPLMSALGFSPLPPEEDESFVVLEAMVPIQSVCS